MNKLKTGKTLENPYMALWEENKLLKLKISLLIECIKDMQLDVEELKEYLIEDSALKLKKTTADDESTVKFNI